MLHGFSPGANPGLPARHTPSIEKRGHSWLAILHDSRVLSRIAEHLSPATTAAVSPAGSGSGGAGSRPKYPSCSLSPRDRPGCTDPLTRWDMTAKYRGYPVLWSEPAHPLARPMWSDDEAKLILVGLLGFLAITIAAGTASAAVSCPHGALDCGYAVVGPMWGHSLRQSLGKHHGCCWLQLNVPNVEMSGRNVRTCPPPEWSGHNVCRTVWHPRVALGC